MSEEDHHMPRWVKVSGIIALVLALVLIAVLVFGSPEHGPGRHLGADQGPAEEGFAGGFTVQILCGRH